jgi:hypothetical protein
MEAPTIPISTNAVPLSAFVTQTEVENALRDLVDDDGKNETNDENETRKR